MGWYRLRDFGRSVKGQTWLKLGQYLGAIQFPQRLVLQPEQTYILLFLRPPFRHVKAVLAQQHIPHSLLHRRGRDVYCFQQPSQSGIINVALPII